MQTNQFLKNNRKTNKNQSHAYRSYTSSSVTKKKHPKSKGNYPAIILAPQQNRGRFTSTNHAGRLKKEKQIAKILDLPASKYNLIFGSKNTSKSKSKTKGLSKGSKIFDITT